MYLNQILEKLNSVDNDLPIRCYLESEKVYSNIYVIGQVKPEYPGVVLGDREPHLRGKDVGGCIQDLETFGEEFKNNNFLFELTQDLDEIHYEIRYFKLSNVVIESGSLVLQSSMELIDSRETYEELELE